ncbi:MAG: hypothetical protein JXR96_08235 [Deltaproteobacteria bacterium]|nr:hypothetical protein [Deltaproteobacteria bacterium]
MMRISRRRFLQLGLGSMGALALGCAGGQRARSAAGRALPWPLLEVSGSAYECGKAIGRRFAREIRAGLERRAEWFSELQRFMRADLATRCKPFLDAAGEHFPDIAAELRGWADGSGVDYLDLVALNLKAELGAMIARQKSESQAAPAGCSTLALASPDRLLLAHNEDGDLAYADLMFCLRISQTGKPAFMCLSYPGILPGNAPAVNEAGLVLTTNFIASSDWKPGVPRYFLDRAILDATSLDQALQIACMPERAFAFHFNLGSMREQRLLSVETSTSGHAVHEVEGLYLHTNHLILPGMRQAAQDMDYVNGSSMSRFRVLEKIKRELERDLGAVRGRDLIRALSSHEGAPYSPCRHPIGEIRGATLASSLFDLRSGLWRVWAGNPCQGEVFELDPGFLVGAVKRL